MMTKNKVILGGVAVVALGAVVIWGSGLGENLVSTILLRTPRQRVVSMPITRGPLTTEEIPTTEYPTTTEPPSTTESECPPVGVPMDPQNPRGSRCGTTDFNFIKVPSGIKAIAIIPKPYAVDDNGTVCKPNISAL